MFKQYISCPQSKKMDQLETGNHSMTSKHASILENNGFVFGMS